MSFSSLGLLSLVVVELLLASWAVAPEPPSSLWPHQQGIRFSSGRFDELDLITPGQTPHLELPRSSDGSPSATPAPPASPPRRAGPVDSRPSAARPRFPPGLLRMGERKWAKLKTPTMFRDATRSERHFFHAGNYGSEHEDIMALPRHFPSASVGEAQARARQELRAAQAAHAEAGRRWKRVEERRASEPPWRPRWLWAIPCVSGSQSQSERDLCRSGDRTAAASDKAATAAKKHLQDVFIAEYGHPRVLKLEQRSKADVDHIHAATRELEERFGPGPLQSPLLAGVKAAQDSAERRHQDHTRMLEKSKTRWARGRRAEPRIPLRTFALEEIHSNALHAAEGFCRDCIDMFEENREVPSGSDSSPLARAYRPRTPPAPEGPRRRRRGRVDVVTSQARREPSPPPRDQPAPLRAATA